ncbi:MAG: NfeD family protein [Kiritimatiellia bacterium]
MNPALIFGLLTLLAFALFVAEVVVPGGVMGGVGGICLLIACGYAIAAFGWVNGIVISLLLILFTLGGFMFWLSKMPDSRVGKRFSLQTVLQSDATPDPRIGLRGEAVTDLRPGGFAIIDGKKTDVVARNGYIEKGSAVLVIEARGSRVQVRAVEGEEA